MTLPSRRDLLALGGAAGVALAFGRPLAAQNASPAALTAREAEVQLAPPSYPATRIWGNDSALPGPVIRDAQGGRVTRRLINDLPQPTSVHWHGLRIDNAMDGVAGLTQDPVAPGGTFDYDFVAPDAGTYWYHAHNRSAEQVARGLYGALVVEEAEAPETDRDEVLVLDDWLLDPQSGQIGADFLSRHSRSHTGRLGNLVATNGRHDHAIEVRRHKRLRLRLVNAANARIFQLALVGLEGWVVALDGMPLEAPAPVAETLLLGPGQRADLIVDVVAEPGEDAHLVRVERGEGFSQSRFPVVGVASDARRDAPAALPPNPGMAPPRLAEARPLRLGMSGGAMGRLDAAILDGRRRSFGQMVEANQFWAFNGTVGMTPTPLAELARDEPVHLAIRNDTAFPHAMHLHGMHFREIAADGTLGPLRDTTLLQRGETREIAFAADNPGVWLFHCHMLSHAESGMMTWLKVT